MREVERLEEEQKLKCLSYMSTFTKLTAMPGSLPVQTSRSKYQYLVFQHTQMTETEMELILLEKADLCELLSSES